jgi:uncharacterized caspase-like protein
LIGRVEGEKLKTTIFDFFRESAREDETLFFYFSGHGIHDSFDDTFLASSNIDRKYVDQNGYNFFDLENVVIKKTPARNVIVALDCWLAGAVNLIGKGGTEEVQKQR